MNYLTLEDAVYIHAEQLRLFGGAAGIRDLGLIEAALLRPQTGYYGDLIEEAAALWESLAMTHGFVDGNKRVAFCLYRHIPGPQRGKARGSSAGCHRLHLRASRSRHVQEGRA